MTGKRCSIGKRCSATCISKRKVCQLELLDSVSFSINKLKKLKLKAPVEVNAPEVSKTDDEKFMEFLRDYDKVSKNPPKLDKLTTLGDFDKKKSGTESLYNSNVKMYHEWISNLLRPVLREELGFGSSSQDKFFERLYSSLEGGSGGRKQLRDAVFNLENFTGESYKRFRDSQIGRGGTKSDLEEAKSIERLLNRKELIKPPVEKFRGASVDTEVLNGMIASAKANEAYSGRALSSWSTDLGVGQRFADIDTGRPEKVIYRAVNKHGVPVRGVSQVKDESEVLTPSSANYRYLGYHPIKVVDKGSGTESIYHVFDVEEF